MPSLMFVISFSLSRIINCVYSQLVTMEVGNPNADNGATVYWASAIETGTWFIIKKWYGLQLVI